MAHDTGSSEGSSRSFGDFSEFLREAVADEESLQMGESLQGVAAQIEAVIEEWRLPHANGAWLAPHLLRLLEALREHHRLLMDLTRDWDRFLEFKAHLAALNQFRSQLAQWAQHVRVPGAQPPAASEFEVSAWRMLGAGALLLDVYEQSSPAGAASAEERSGAWSRLMGWIRNEVK